MGGSLPILTRQAVKVKELKNIREDLFERLYLCEMFELEDDVPEDIMFELEKEHVE